MKKFLIITGGYISDYSYLLGKIKDDLSDGMFIICADSGYDYALKMGIAPNVVLGDFDSIKSEVPKSALNYPTKKDKTDTELALDYAIEKGAKHITLLGALGTRVDHSLANIMLLFHYRESGAHIRIINEHNELFLAKEENIIERSGETVSLIPLTKSLVTTKGFEYELLGSELLPGHSLGVSNVSMKENAVIKCYKGELLIIIANENSINY
ncbi:MAG: thiamine diphosphokinase [Defluviitaleaceae bacterium]|nr:thiamine diphosphokinase [Defluviitaleaceae bacterium]